MDLPNVYWTFTTPFATIIGLFSNVGEIEGAFDDKQIAWFKSELKAADPNLALVVAVHHPPYSGDTEHSGSTVVHKVLFDSFEAVGRYPHLVLSGHVHNYQRFTVTVQGGDGPVTVPCIVAGAGGYTKLGKLHKIDGAFPEAPLTLDDGLTLEQYDQDNFGFLRIEVGAKTITGTYFSAPYNVGGPPQVTQVDQFHIDLASHAVG